MADTRQAFYVWKTNWNFKDIKRYKQNVFVCFNMHERTHARTHTYITYIFIESFIRFSLSDWKSSLNLIFFFRMIWHIALMDQVRFHWQVILCIARAHEIDILPRDEFYAMRCDWVDYKTLKKFGQYNGVIAIEYIISLSFPFFFVSIFNTPI